MGGFPPIVNHQINKTGQYIISMYQVVIYAVIYAVFHSK